MTTSMKNASAKTLTLSPRLLTVAGVTELGEKIERARDDDGPRRACAGPGTGPGGVRVEDGVDMLEIGFGAGGELPCPQGPRVRGLRGDEALPEDGERLQHRLGPLVVEDRRDDDPVVARG